MHHLPSPSNYPHATQTQKRTVGLCVCPPLSPGEHVLHLYQLAAPSLCERVKAFGNKLALKDEWVCVDKPYFEAPGECDVCGVCGVCGGAAKEEWTYVV
eukprot:11920-Chlamydomonas_euryale.AAC.1